MGNQPSSVRGIQDVSTQKLGDVQKLSSSLKSLSLLDAEPDPAATTSIRQAPTLSHTYTVDHIPYDVWVPIFKAFLLVDHGGYAKLVSVSKYWRNLVKGTPSLWTNISIDSKALDSQDLPGRFSKTGLQTMLGIEASLPRSMAHSGWVDVSWFRQHIPKIRSLKVQHGSSLRMIRWHNTFDNLGTLSLGCLSRAEMFALQSAVIPPQKKTVMGTDRLCAPKLERVYLHDVSRLMILPLPWEQITSLTLKGIREQSADDFYGMLLLRLPRLQHLKASITFWELDPDKIEWLKPLDVEAGEQIIPMPIGQLVTLDVDFGDHTKPFFDRVKLPKLEQLSVTLPRSDLGFWYGNFTRLAERSKFPLRKVTMKNSPIILENSARRIVHVIHSVLLAAPTIEILEVENSCTLSYTLLKALESPKLGPELRYLKVVSRLSEFNGGATRNPPNGDEERSKKRARQPNFGMDSEDEESDDGGSEATAVSDEEDEIEEEAEDAWKIKELERRKEAEREKLEKKRKFMDAAEAAQRNLLKGGLKGMLTARHEDRGQGQVISLSPSHPAFRHAAIVRARVPQMGIRSTEDFEDFWTREGEEVKEREVQRVHIFF